MEMIFIKGGSYLMGSPEHEKGRRDDEQQHQSEVSDFYLGQYPATNAEYRQFKPDHDSGKGFNGDDQPVVNVDWNDATAYTEWLSRETGENYRLPTEAEWEYACRAGTTTRFSFGDDAKELGDFAWYDRNSSETTQSVGQKKPNPWGLHDMHGNVWEWTASAYDEAYGGAEAVCAGRDDSAPRVARGGSWCNFPRVVRSAFRIWGGPAGRGGDSGFRLARTIKP